MLSKLSYQSPYLVQVSEALLQYVYIEAYSI